MISAVMANTGYLVGIGIEVFIILICAALLALMLTGLLFKWLNQFNETRLVKAEARAAANEARAVAEEEAAAQAAAEAEAERARLEYENAVKKEAEAAAAEAAAVAAAKQAEEEAKRQPLPKAAQPAEPAVTEEPEKKVVTERVIEKVVIVEQQKAAEPEVVAQPAPEVVEEAAATEAEDEEEMSEGENGFVVVQDGIVFNDSKTITELYDELSPEQQSYFDELREEALTKPDAELAIAKNFVTVKIGKRNLIKLLIKRGVTVAEFMLENDALKQLRLSNTNKRGKSAIKIKPTVVQVLDLNSLKVAVDMINLAYEEMMYE